jgi:hypothetical protein
MYIKLSSDKIIRGDIVTHHVSFIPDQNINCDPPYRIGKLDSGWIKYQKEFKIDVNDQSLCEKLIGIKLQEFS